MDKTDAPRVKQVRVRASATSANLGAGFDCLGLALELYMDLAVAESEGEGLEIVAMGEGSGSVPLDERNAVYQGVVRAYARAGKTPGRLSLAIDSQIPLASGLGSSSAALVAGLTAGAELCGLGLDREEVWRGTRTMLRPARWEGSSSRPWTARRLRGRGLSRRGIWPRSWPYRIFPCPRPSRGACCRSGLSGRMRYLMPGASVCWWPRCNRATTACCGLGCRIGCISPIERPWFRGWKRCWSRLQRRGRWVRP
ncbi:MAG: hypothetical protein J4F35_16870 [Candidatus Latescibacteria bacterium]|nr:hypothetical protein [Candidatus Latescibacterota bacterium]